MDAILHKLCEKSQQELWDLLKENDWTKDHAEVAFYMVEILKGVKKIEHLKLVQEAMDRAEEMGEEGMEHMLGREQKPHHYARRVGRPRMPMRYDMYGYDEGEGEDKPMRTKEPDWYYPPYKYDYEESHWEKKYKELLEEREKDKEKNINKMPTPPTK